MNVSSIQRHALHMLLTRCEGGVFDFFLGRAFAASNTFEALERKGLIVRVMPELAPNLYAVTRRGRAEACLLGRSPQSPQSAQIDLPLGGPVSSVAA